PDQGRARALGTRCPLTDAHRPCWPSAVPSAGPRRRSTRGVGRRGPGHGLLVRGKARGRAGGLPPGDDEFPAVPSPAAILANFPPTFETPTPLRSFHQSFLDSWRGLVYHSLSLQGLGLGADRGASGAVFH